HFRTGDRRDGALATAEAHRVDLDADDVIDLEEAPPGFVRMLGPGQFAQAPVHHLLHGRGVDAVVGTYRTRVVDLDDATGEAAGHAARGAGHSDRAAGEGPPQALAQPGSGAAGSQAGTGAEQEAAPRDATTAAGWGSHDVRLVVADAGVRLDVIVRREGSESNGQRENDRPGHPDSCRNLGSCRDQGSWQGPRGQEYLPPG